LTRPSYLASGRLVLSSQVARSISHASGHRRTNVLRRHLNAHLAHGRSHVVLTTVCFSTSVSFRYGPVCVYQLKLEIVFIMLSFFMIFTCDSIYAIACICHANSVHLSVCPSATRVLCVKTAERIIDILSLSDRSIILVFRHQGLLHKSDSFSTNRGAKYKGVAIFGQYAAISRKR